MAEKIENKQDEINWNDSLDYTYSSIKDTMFETINFIEGRYRRKFKDEVIETCICWLEFCKEDLIVLGARPYIGKSSFILSLISDFILNKNIPVGLVTPGTIDRDIDIRLLAINSEVPISKIRSGMMRIAELEKVQKTANALFEAPLYFYDEPNCSFKNLKDNVLKMALEEHIQLLFIDGFKYIQEIIDADSENYRTRLARLLTEFKTLAMDLHIPIILTLDLPATKNNEEPTIQDLRKNMIIADKADKILFLHRNRLYDYRVNYQDAELITIKKTAGPYGTFPLHFYPITCKFSYKEDN